MFNRAKLEKRLVLQPDKTYCIRQIDLSLYVNRAKVNVGDGCSAIHYVNGQEEKHRKGEEFKVNLGHGREESLLCVSTDINYKFNWGTPNGVVYIDPELKLETNIGMNGEINVSVSAPLKLVRVSGESNVTPQYIKENVLLKISQIARDCLSQASKGRKYDEVDGMTAKLAEKIGDPEKGQLAEVLNNMGITLVDLTVAGIHFPDDYLEARAEMKAKGKKSDLDSMLEKERQEAAASNGESELDKVKRIAETFKNLNPQQGGVAKKTCPKCGKVCNADTLYCPKCGQKLD